MRRAPALPLVSVLVGLALVAGGCSTGSPGESDGSEGSEPATTSAAVERRDVTDADFDAVRRLLDVRAKAVVAGDREAFLATVDPQIDPDGEQADHQANLFDNLRELKVAKLYYGMVPLGLLPDDVTGGDAVLRPELHEHVQLAGINERPVANQVSMTFVERDGRWYVAHERLDETFKPQSRPWFGTRIDVAAGKGLLVLTDLDAEVDAAELLDSTRAALAEVVDVLDKPVDGPLLVDATTNGQATELSNVSGIDAGAVFQGTYAADRTGQKFLGRAGAVVKANPGYVSDLIEDARLLRHELTHYVLDTEYVDRNPQWVTEGIAEYVSYRPLLLEDSVFTDEALEQRLADREVRLVPPGRWGDDPDLDYLCAQAFTEYLVTRYGIEKFLELMATFERVGIAEYTPYGEGILDRVLRQTYGTTPAAVARGGFDLLEGLSG